MDKDAAGTDILAPVSIGRLNARHKPAQSGKKRKREDVEDMGSVFEATAIPPSSVSRSLTFTPQQLLQRSSVPLSWLDTTVQDSLVPPCFLFNAKIGQLQDLRQHAEPQILIVKLCPSGGLYAVERVGMNSYIAFQLSKWVDKEMVEQAARGEASEATFEQLLSTLGQGGETGSVKKAKLDSLQLSKTSSPRKPMNRRGAMARMSMFPVKSVPEPEPTDIVSPTPKAFTASTTDGVSDVSKLGAASNTDIEATTIGAGVESTRPVAESSLSEVAGCRPVLPEKPSTDAIVPFSIDILRKQYFETLYLSKTSLAYFAKGPLARARALVQNSESTDDLAKVYREIILPSKKMELKYKDSISNRIEAISAGAEEGTPGTRNTKGGKKAKLGKDGLFSDEHQHLDRWWQEREAFNTADISLASRNLEMRTLIGDLRIRETEMQLLLLLEILALEMAPALISNKHLNETIQVKAEPSDQQEYVGQAQTPRKTKHKRDLMPDLESLIDKLCIWHTIGIDELLASPEKTRAGDKREPSKVKDKLRDFCADVIIPFYASRLHEPCKMICRRLGGPEVSPARPKALLKKALTTSRLPPGATIMARPRAVPKRSLERVLSEDQTMRHASPPILSRSSTTSALPTLKREPSESSQRPSSRAGMHKSVSFTNREIDLVADAKAHEAKRKKLARLAAQKKELDAAIDALKKPNRTKAAQGIMEDYEKRGTEARLNSKLLDQGVQVSATPKRPRSKEQWPGEPSCGNLSSIELPAEGTAIPNNTARPKHSAEGRAASRSSTTKRATLSIIHGTPSRGLFTSSSVHQLSKAELPVSSMQQRLDFVQATPATNRLRPDMNINVIEATPLRMFKSQRAVMLTPVKKADVRIEDVFRDAPVITEQAGKAMDRVMGGSGGGNEEASIYDSLGWNDDFE